MEMPSPRGKEAGAEGSSKIMASTVSLVPALEIQPVASLLAWQLSFVIKTTHSILQLHETARFCCVLLTLFLRLVCPPLLRANIERILFMLIVQTEGVFWKGLVDSHG